MNRWDLPETIKKETILLIRLRNWPHGLSLPPSSIFLCNIFVSSAFVIYLSYKKYDTVVKVCRLCIECTSKNCSLYGLLMKNFLLYLILIQLGGVYLDTGHIMIGLKYGISGQINDDNVDVHIFLQVQRRLAQNREAARKSRLRKKVKRTGFL